MGCDCIPSTFLLLIDKFSLFTVRNDYNKNDMSIGGGLWLTALKCEAWKGKHMQVHSEQLVMKRRLQSSIFGSNTMPVCHLRWSPDVHSRTTKKDPSSDQESVNGDLPQNSVNINPHDGQCRFDCEALFGARDRPLHPTPFRARFCALVTVTTMNQRCRARHCQKSE